MFSKIYNKDNRELLSVHNSIYALNEATWKEIQSSKKGVVLSESILTAMIANGVEIIVEIGISKS